MNASCNLFLLVESTVTSQSQTQATGFPAVNTKPRHRVLPMGGWSMVSPEQSSSTESGWRREQSDHRGIWSWKIIPSPQIYR